jgi:hypothetical protein
MPLVDRTRTSFILPGLPDGLFFKPKIPIWLNFGVPLNGKCLYIL